jgi:hypothetical protein
VLSSFKAEQILKIKKRKAKFCFRKAKRGKNLQREGAEEAPLYCNQKMHYWRQGKTTQGKKLIDLN